MLRQAVAARRSVTGLASQRISSRLPSATVDLVARQFLARPPPGSLRHASFLPWRKHSQAVKQPLPVYFPRPRRWPSLQQVRRKLGYFVLAGCIYYMCFQVFLSVVLGTLLDYADELETQLPAGEDEEDEEDPFFFLPFPFGIQAVEQPPYKGSDPEWRTFVKVNKDKKLQEEIKLELVNMVRKMAQTNLVLAHALGAKEPQVKKYWLDVIYPPTPPPKYYLSGLIIDDEGIFWGDRPVDSLAAKQINAAIYPKAIAHAAWAFVDHLITGAVQDVAGAFGFKDPEEPQTTWHSTMMDRLKEQKGLGPGTNQVVKVSEQSDKPPSFSITTGASTALNTLFPPELQGQSRVQDAFNVAVGAFRKNWRSLGTPPGRGCIIVDGQVEVQGKRAVLLVHVSGWYDPVAKKYVSVDSKVKHLLPLKQKPAEG